MDPTGVAGLVGVDPGGGSVVPATAGRPAGAGTGGGRTGEEGPAVGVGGVGGLGGTVVPDGPGAAERVSDVGVHDLFPGAGGGGGAPCTGGVVFMSGIGRGGVMGVGGVDEEGGGGTGDAGGGGGGGAGRAEGMVEGGTGAADGTDVGPGPLAATG